MAKQLKKEQRAQIVALAEEGFTYNYIANKYKVNQSTVKRTIKKHREYNEYGHLGENGRKSALTREVISIISKENSVNSKKSLRKIKSIVESKIVGENKPYIS